MKRTLPILLAAFVIAACASPFAKPETADQALAASATKMSAVKSAKFDLTGTLATQVSPALAQALSQQIRQLPPGFSFDNLTTELKGAGEAKFPDQLHITTQIRTGGISVNSEEIVSGTKVYVKDPITGKWTNVTGSNKLNGQLNQLDPLSATEILNSAKSVTDLGDTRIGDVQVRHLKIEPDKAKLAERLDKSPALKNPQARAAIRDILDRGDFLVEVWIGKDDHLLRRLRIDSTIGIDLNQLLSAFGGPGTTPPSTPTLPAGSTVNVKGQVVVDYHDFNAPVTITEPQVSG